jgi:hypothetical protein
MEDQRDGAAVIVTPNQGIAEARTKLRRLVIELFDERTWFLTDAVIAVYTSGLLVDIANPPALIFVDGAATGKTTILDFFNGLRACMVIDKFTPSAFLTQAVNVKRNQRESIDLLAKIPFRVLQSPEMAPTFAQPKEVLLENYAIMARVLDGTGLSNAGGVHGYRELRGDYYFGLVGATTPLSAVAWNTFSKVGSRFLFVAAPAKPTHAERRQRALNLMQTEMHYKQKKKIVGEAVREFIELVYASHRPAEYTVPPDFPKNLKSIDALLSHCGYLPRTVNWDRQQDDRDTLDWIALLADFGTTARQDIRVWSERGDEGQRETNSSGAIQEGIDRFATILYNFARSHALSAGRTGIGPQDLPLIVAATLSSIPDDRRKAIELLIDPNTPGKDSELGMFTSKELQKSLSCSDKTATNVMSKLEIIGLGQIEKVFGPSPDVFILDSDWGQLLSEAFREIYPYTIKEGIKSGLEDDEKLGLPF